MTNIQKILCGLWVLGALVQYISTLKKGIPFQVPFMESAYTGIFVVVAYILLFIVIKTLISVGLSLLANKKLGVQGISAWTTALTAFFFINAYGFFRVRSFFMVPGDKPVLKEAQVSDIRFFAAAGVVLFISLVVAFILKKIENNSDSSGSSKANSSHAGVFSIVIVVLSVLMYWHIFVFNYWNTNLFSKPVPPAERDIPNVVLITIDTLSSYYTDFFHGNGVTPTLTELAGQGVAFPRTITSISITAPSHSTILTGLSPQTHGLLNNANSLPDSVTSLAEILRDRGYNTAAFTNVFHTSTKYNIHQGFDAFHTEWYSASIPVTLLYDTDMIGFLIRRFMSRSFWKNNPTPELENVYKTLNWLDAKSDTPFFLWHHTMLPHRPYKPTKEVRDMLGIPELPAWEKTPEIENMELVKQGKLDRAEVKKLYIDMYRGDIYLADRVVKSIVEKLKEKNMLDNTILVVTSDHGEHVMSHYDFLGHGYYNYDDTLLVPLIFRFPPAIASQGAREQKFKLVDIMPTVLQLLSIPVPPEVEGKGMMDMLLDPSVPEPLEPFVSETMPPSSPTYRNAVHYGDLKYMVDFKTGEEEFYNIIKDPWEMDNLIEKEEFKADVDQLRNFGVEWMNRVKPKMSAEEETYSPQVRQKLKDLGYIR